MASSSLKKVKVKVTCSEGEVLEIDEALVNESQTLKCLMEEKRNKGQIEINLPDISRETLTKISEYVEKLVEASREKRLYDWDAEFSKVDMTTMFALLNAAHYLKLEKLVNLGTQYMAGVIRGKSVEEIRRIFNIENDFSPEEEEESQRRAMLMLFAHFFSQS